ncbi:hypothetical protein DRF67_11230 [Chryseobacterium pennipullorum]|uniref:Uncharacterized protein n=1 Tax=Chryseobacterium pennipullorum TaxID=2258963 RepID=A0A3D9B0Q8_9FLAO|nr:hypothetical protein DRF67_11230 [Chryseobacterium pennipullorum]
MPLFWEGIIDFQLLSFINVSSGLLRIRCIVQIKKKYYDTTKSNNLHIGLRLLNLFKLESLKYV